MTRPDRFDAWDAVLFAFGVLGVLAFAWLLPSQHPDSAASYALGRDEAVDRSQAFLEAQGYATDELTPLARLGRDPRLLDSLQTALGRPEAIRALEAGADDVLPAYHWTVRWQHPERKPMFGPPSADDASGRLVYEVDLTQRGAVWQFRNPQGLTPRAGVDRTVLRSLLGAEPEMGAMLMVPADSALGALLYFDLSSASELSDSLALFQADQQRLRAAAETGRPQGLGEAAAAAIARVHVGETALAELPLVVTAVEALPERGRSAARVRFETSEHVHGQRARVEADVTAAGALLALQTRFNADVGAEAIQFQLGSDRGWRGALKWGGYLLLTFMLLGVVFRRLSGRSLDARAALKDALVAGGGAMMAVALSAPVFAIEAGYGWQLAIFLAVGMLFSGAGLGLLVFMASAASDALARAAWPEKIETLSLVRQHAWINQPVGQALLRGAAGAGLVLGLVTVGMALVPQGRMAAEPLFVFESSYSVLASAFAQCVWYALLLVLAVYVGLGSSLRKRWAGAVVPGLGVAVAIVGFDAVELLTGTWWLTWGAPLVLGLVLAVLFRRYDALTLLVTVVLVGMLWDTAEGWLVAASPARIDAVLGFVLFLGFVAVGFLGVRSARTGETLPRYEPDYVTEQRERGRLQRELEIAREVQRSFLPAEMPHVTGLDLAARCLAAEEVGGDYYDAIPLGPDRLVLIIGDVSGKGIQASFFMTLAKGFLQTLARETESPAEVLRRTNRLFCANAPRGTFISLIYGIFDLDARTFTFARAGHNPVILKRSPNQTADFVQPAGLAIGLTLGAAFDETIEEQTIALRPGDTLVLYTDGFSEAMDRRKTLYTDERIADRVAGSHTATAADLLDALVADVQAHAVGAGQHDDMTMVVVKVAQPRPADGRPVASEAVAAP
jgi:hypothetical protein